MKQRGIKRSVSVFFSILLAAWICLAAVFQASFSSMAAEKEGNAEFRGVWFSYIDWNDMPEDVSAFKKKADQVMEDIAARGMNAIFCHVHSHSDSYYLKSSYFPASKFTAALREQDKNFDPIQYMIEAAHQRGLQFHAWVNPYRVTGYLMKWEEVPESGIVKRWAGSAESARNVLLHEGQYYLNPAKQEVRERLTAAIRELVENYEVDGVQFDDYFYPLLDDKAEGKSFDRQEYLASGTQKSLTQFRRDNVSALVKAVHEAVHEARPSAVFGISPVPFLDSLRSEKAYFVDIDLWMKSTDYVDYILPQLYVGFEAKTRSGEPSAEAFTPCLKSWVDLKKSLHSPVKLYAGLALYKTGTDAWDGNAVPEWLRYTDILARQVEAARATGEVSGFGIYDYMNFDDAVCQTELDNLQAMFH